MAVTRSKAVARRRCARAAGSKPPTISAASSSARIADARFSSATSPRIVDGDARPSSYVSFHARGRTYPAVTIAIAKRTGTNAIDVARRIEQKLELLKGTTVPADLQMSVTRNYGETAAEKSNELLWHMLLAVISVSLLIWLALGKREAAVVLLAVPVTLALTLFTFYLYGYTLNRITLFALIFSIGILVDDAIVVVENIVRHARLSIERTGRPGGDRHPRRRRGRQPDDPGDADGHRRHPADGIRRRPDGALHAADSRRRFGGHGVLARRRIHRHALGRGSPAATGRRGGSRSRRSPDPALPARA